ncbi:glycosyl hydrolase [Terrisporobacter petrolearius]|uniref:glycosyl hydrolase n=1 Tax=Terrisporobacter petrolearius TaxID=1460447 RepID=UPI003AFF7EF7
MNKLKQILVSLITNPILIMAYGFFFYKLDEICKYGRHNYNLQILILLTVFFILVIIITSIKSIKNKKDNLSRLARSKPWKYTSIALIIAITSFYGYNIYKSSVNFGGKLSWFILRAKTERSVEFEHNNFYKYGVAGIFNDINEKYPLPKKLYISNEFQLQFNSDGKITDLYAFVYGKNKDGQEKSYLITYDNKSNKMTLRLDGVVNGDYNEYKLLDPLVETVRAINIKKSYLKNNEKEYGLLYSGKRSWGYNTTGLISIYEDGHELKLEDIYNIYLEEFSGEITGYSVSLYIPNKKEEITPFRYNLINDTDWSKSQNILPGYNPNKEEEKPDELNNPNKSNKEEFHLSNKIGYKLNPMDAALGSVFYELIKTTDGGATTSIFDFPTVPYKEGGVLNMIVAQGQDGDYN